jgi:AraC family transcriptional regulator of adaptative response/methylated-DNA-[protein]-cysteine methyltransferase
MAVNLALPSNDELWRAVVTHDAAYEGVFVVAVRTTGVFCRPACPSREPKRANVEFFGTTADALAAGYRPCRRCHPLEPLGARPAWLADLIDAVEAKPDRRWRDRDIRELGLDPARVRRWFVREHGITFQGYARARRVGSALGAIRNGRSIIDAGLDHGWDSTSAFRDAFAKHVGVTPGRAHERGAAITTRLLTPLGPMVAAAIDDGIVLLEYADRPMLPTLLDRIGARFGAAPVPGDHSLLERLRGQLGEFFAGRRTVFDIPLAARGSRFEEACWAWLLTIPSGRTRTYGDGAAAVGRPGAARAVGRAIGANPIAIVVPCHRVVGSDGQLTGYGGGVWRKQKLLEIEANAAAPLGSPPPIAVAGGGCTI